VEGGMLWRNGCDGKVLRCGAGERHQHGLAMNDNGVIRTSLENEHEPLKSNQTFLWAVFNEKRKKWFWFLRCSGSTFERLHRGVPVGIGLAIAL
jgi:hypothetical protein